MDFGDLDANRFRAINQFTIEGSKQLRRPDIICFINGLPVAVIELKSPSAENVDIWDAFNQIQTYKDEIPDCLPTTKRRLLVMDLMPVSAHSPQIKNGTCLGALS